jgi:hypothetical protein
MSPSAQSALPPPTPGQGGGEAPMSPQSSGQSGNSSQMIDLVRNIVSSARMLGQMVPGAVPIIQQINDLAQQLQAKILQAQPAPEPVAPPM